MRVPPLATTVSWALPPLETISVPPLSVYCAVPPNSTITSWPLSRVPLLDWPPEMMTGPRAAQESNVGAAVTVAGDRELSPGKLVGLPSPSA